RRRLCAPPGRSGDGPARARRLADRERGRRILPGRKHREHRVDHPRRARRRVASVAAASQPPRLCRRGRASRRRLARGRRRPGVSALHPAAAGTSAYWFLARGTGAVALLLLTGSVVLGVLGSVRFDAGPRWPRFTIDALHRDVSLLVMVFLVLHVLTSVLDSFAPISLLDAVIPFAGTYRPFWLGLGAVSFDLLIALVVTSLARRRLGYRSWRAIHWLAYASWPVAVFHGLGTGSDSMAWWMLALTGACVAAVLLAVFVRIARTDSS